MESTQGVICLQYVLVLGESLICFILATKCLTMDVAPNLQLVCPFSCVMLMQWVFCLFVCLVGWLVLVFVFLFCLFYLSPTLGFGIFRNWGLNVDDFSIHWFSLPLLMGSVLKVSTFHKIHHANSRGLKKKILLLGNKLRKL